MSLSSSTSSRPSSRDSSSSSPLFSFSFRLSSNPSTPFPQAPARLPHLVVPQICVHWIFGGASLDVRKGLAPWTNMASCFPLVLTLVVVAGGLRLGVEVSRGLGGGGGGGGVVVVVVVAIVSVVVVVLDLPSQCLTAKGKGLHHPSSSSSSSSLPKPPSLPGARVEALAHHAPEHISQTLLSALLTANFSSSPVSPPTLEKSGVAVAVSWIRRLGGSSSRASGGRAGGGGVSVL